MQIMQDAAIVPIIDQGFPNFSSSRTKGAVHIHAEHWRSRHYQPVAIQR